MSCGHFTLPLQQKDLHRLYLLLYSQHFCGTVLLKGLVSAGGEEDQLLHPLAFGFVDPLPSIEFIKLKLEFVNLDLRSF